MITLPLTFKSGEGGYSVNPLIYTQIARKGLVAVYSRTTAEGHIKDYEVVKIRVIPAGTAIFNAPPSTEDEEKYAVTSSWGRCGWSYGNKTAALAKMEEVAAKNDADEADEVEAAPYVIPIKEFTVGEFATANDIAYPVAFLYVKAQVEAGSVVFVREERRNVKGKASKIYSKAPTK